MRTRRTWCLAAILALAAALRFPALEWGLPPTTLHVKASDFRCSYAFDEDDLLTHVSFTKPAGFDFDPRTFVWGTLHLHLLTVWMEAAEHLGFAGEPWRQAYYQLTPGAFERVYAAGRALTCLIALLSIWLVYRFGSEFDGAATGLWAAAFTAASPAHLLASVQIRVDLTMVCLIVIACWIGLRLIRGRRGSYVLGLAAGLAITAKYPAAAITAPILIVVVIMAGLRARAVVLLMLGAVTGLILGEPYALLRWSELTTQMGDIFETNRKIPAGLRPAVAALLATHLLQCARFLTGPGLALASIAGLAMMARNRHAPGLLIAAGLTGGIVSWIPLIWPLLRYELPLLPFLAVSGAFAITRFPPKWSVTLGAAALLFPLAASLDQLWMMRSPHPGNQALDAILQTVPPGSHIARLTVEMPPLDRKIYPPGPNPFLEDLTATKPEWVLTTDLPVQEYPRANMTLLSSEYFAQSQLTLPRRFSWATLGETGAPHDWKYTHPGFVLYQRRAP